MKWSSYSSPGGADVNAATEGGDTSVSFAREKEFDDVVRLLLSHGAKRGPTDNVTDTN